MLWSKLTTRPLCPEDYTKSQYLRPKRHVREKSKGSSAQGSTMFFAWSTTRSIRKSRHANCRSTQSYDPTLSTALFSKSMLSSLILSLFCRGSSWSYCQPRTNKICTIIQRRWERLSALTLMLWLRRLKPKKTPGWRALMRVSSTRYRAA